MDLQLKGKHALVTGASQGIGMAIAAALAAEGCHLHLAARNPQTLQALADRLHAEHGVQMHTHPADLSTAQGIQALARACADVDKSFPLAIAANASRDPSTDTTLTCPARPALSMAERHPSALGSLIGNAASNSGKRPSKSRITGRAPSVLPRPAH